MGTMWTTTCQTRFLYNLTEPQNSTESFSVSYTASLQVIKIYCWEFKAFWNVLGPGLELPISLILSSHSKNRRISGSQILYMPFPSHLTQWWGQSFRKQSFISQRGQTCCGQSSVRRTLSPQPCTGSAAALSQSQFRRRPHLSQNSQHVGTGLFSFVLSPDPSLLHDSGSTRDQLMGDTLR